MSDESAYRGALGAFPYAARTSESWAFRAYAAVATLAGLGVVLLFLLSLVGVVASTAGQSEIVTLARAFVLVVMLAVLVPIVAPVLLVARRHRLGRAVDPRYDRALAIGGFCFLAALYVGLLVSASPGTRRTPPRIVAPVVETLYALPQIAGLVPPLLAAALIWLLHRRFGNVED